jgi:APA family basic amino acid/polyamine antiporter
MIFYPSRYNLSKVPDKIPTVKRGLADTPSGAPALLRQLGVVSAAALVISNMVGTGIFAATGFLAADLGDPFLVLGIWIVGALVALSGAFCYSELGINFPSSGGEYVYLTRAYGPTWGFMTGWTSFFAGFSAPIAAAALVFSYYLAYFFPALRQDQTAFTVGSGALSISIGGAQLLASALILVFTVVNIFGVSRVAKLQNVLTAVKLLVLVAFILLAFTSGAGSWEHLSQPGERLSRLPISLQFALSLFWIYLCYSGWNAATYVAEELKRPERTLPVALTLGTLVVTALFMILNVVFIYAIPVGEMREGGEPMRAIGSGAAARLFGPEAAGTFSALFALSLMATVNAMVTIGPRVYYAMAKNGAFFKGAARVHRRWHTPVTAIWWQGLCAVLMTLTPFRELIGYIGFMLTAFAVLAVSSLFVFRRRPDWQRLPAVSFLFPVVPVFFILVGAWTIAVGFWGQPKVSLAAVATVATGAAAYHFHLKKR